MAVGGATFLAPSTAGSPRVLNGDAADFTSVPGVGGPERQYIGPEWFAAADQTLNIDPSPSRLLPDTRAFLATSPIFDRGRESTSVGSDVVAMAQRTSLIWRKRPTARMSDELTRLPPCNRPARLADR